MTSLLDPASDIEKPPSPPPAGKSRPAWRRFVSGRFIGWTLVVALLAAWQITTKTGLLDTPNIPPLSDVVSELITQIRTGGPLFSSLAQTFRVLSIGYVIGVAIGVVLGSLMGTIRFLHSLLEPLVELIRPIPVTAIVPLLVLFLGIGQGLTVFLVAKATLFPVLLNTYAGIRSVPETLTDTARTFGLSRLQALGTIGFPFAIPSIVVGARVSLAAALVVTVLTEMITGNSGVGYYLMISQQTLSVTKLYAGVIVVAAIGYVLNLIFNVIESRLLRWHVSSPGGIPA
jgi:ABC-type nitrate/sulfonate/bicarbonate transport system permease component